MGLLPPRAKKHINIKRQLRIAQLRSHPKISLCGASSPRNEWRRGTPSKRTTALKSLCWGPFESLFFMCFLVLYSSHDRNLSTLPVENCALMSRTRVFFLSRCLEHSQTPLDSANAPKTSVHNASLVNSLPLTASSAIISSRR